METSIILEISYMKNTEEQDFVSIVYRKESFSQPFDRIGIQFNKKGLDELLETSLGIFKNEDFPQIKLEFKTDIPDYLEEALRNLFEKKYEELRERLNKKYSQD